MKFVPREPQEVIIDHIINTPRCGVWAGMGMGKSSSTLSALNTLSLVERDIFPALIIAPFRVAQTTWPDEVDKWEEFSHLRISAIVGSAEERRAALAKPADIYTINYENLPWLLDQLGGKDKWPFKTVVSDEATRLKNVRVSEMVSKTGKKFLRKAGGVRAKSLAEVAHTKINRFIELTGTPSPKGLEDLWGQGWFLDGGARLGRNHTAFKQRWFQRSFDGYSIEPLPFAQEQIQGKLKDICVSVDPADYFDLQVPIINPIYVDLPPKAREQYKKMQREMFIEFDSGHTIEAFNAGAKTMKCLQLANGAAYIDNEDGSKKDKEWIEVHDEKIQALESIIEEANGMPVLVAYHFKSDLDRLKAAFPKGRVLDKDPKTIRDWNAGKIRTLFAHPASAGHGLNLQDGSNILAFFSLNWNLEEHLQIIERIGPMRQFQAGHNRAVFIHYIIARGTVDELVLKSLREKQTVQQVLLEAMKANGTA